jgi:NTP pyrophosphatase (non-canonical NTP hydrolase)
MNGIEQIESAVATIEIELAYIKAAIDKLNKGRYQLSDVFREKFGRVLELADLVYESHIPEKGHSWETTSMSWMIDSKLEEELGEYKRAVLPSTRLKEIIDVLNTVLMIAAKESKEVTGEKKDV